MHVHTSNLNTSCRGFIKCVFHILKEVGIVRKNNRLRPIYLNHLTLVIQFIYRMWKAWSALCVEELIKVQKVEVGCFKYDYYKFGYQ